MHQCVDMYKRDVIRDSVSPSSSFTRRNKILNTHRVRAQLPVMLAFSNDLGYDHLNAPADCLLFVFALSE